MTNCKMCGAEISCEYNNCSASHVYTDYDDVYKNWLDYNESIRKIEELSNSETTNNVGWNIQQCPKCSGSSWYWGDDFYDCLICGAKGYDNSHYEKMFDSKGSVS